MTTINGIDINKLSNEELRKILTSNIRPAKKNMLIPNSNDPAHIKRAKEARKLFKKWLRQRNK